MRRSIAIAVGLAALGALALNAPAAAGTVSKKVKFELGKWYDLGVTDGPATLHRIRVERMGESVKSHLMRPGNSEYTKDVRIELEYSNTATRDWNVAMHVHLLDDDGTVIDGYNDSETLDDSSSNDLVTVTLSTLQYGLDHAKTLSIELTFGPD